MNTPIDAGDDIYIYWENYDGSAGFDWNISLAPVLSGDKCDGAVAATLGTNTVPETIKNEYWYTYTMASDGWLGFGTDVKLYTECDGSLLNPDGQGNEFFYAGTEVFIKVNSENGGGYEWNLELTPLTSGQACQLALPAVLGTNTITEETTSDYIYGTWYTYTMPFTGNLEITSNTLHGVQLYSGCDDNFEIPIDGGGGVGNATEATFQEGDIVYIYWSNTFVGNGIYFDWNLAVTAFVAGDRCSDPIAATNGTNAVPETINSVLWYEYTMPQDGKVTVSYPEDTNMSVFTSSCVYDQAEDVIGRSTYPTSSSQTILDLTQGDKVRMKLFPQRGGFDFNITVSDHDVGDVCEVPAMAVLGVNTVPATLSFEYYFTYLMPSDGVFELIWDDADLSTGLFLNGCNPDTDYVDYDTNPLFIDEGDTFVKIAASTGDVINIEFEIRDFPEGISEAFDFEIIVSDPVPTPDVSSLPDITAECPVTELTAPTATGGTGNSVTGTTEAVLPISYTQVIRWIYRDGAFVSSQYQQVSVDDVTGPVPNVSQLQEIIAECSVVSLQTPGATDNCGGGVTVTNDANFPITATTFVTWTYEDEDGNTTTQDQDIIINDTSGPEPDIATLEDVTAQCSVSELETPSATDNCGGEVTVSHNAVLPIEEQGTTIVTWTYQDAGGNPTTQNQNVVIDDTTAPVPDFEELSVLSDACSITSLTPPTATDNCTGNVTVTNNITLPITTNTVIIWSYEDSEGNISTQEQSVVISDDLAPVPDASSLETVTDDCSVASLPIPTATDNCGSVTVTNNVTFPITGTRTVVWTFEDGSGNKATLEQSVVIADGTPPVPDASTLSAVNSECAVTDLVAPTATDACGGSVTVSNNASFPISTSTEITWTYQDGSGNSVTQTQNVVIDDVSAPVPDVADLQDVTGQCSVTSLSAPTATDNCDGTVDGSVNVSFPITANTTLTWVYVDLDGNQSSQTQNVVIDDTTGPVPDASTLDEVNDVCSVASLVAPTATDNCGGNVTVTNNASFPITTTTVVTWTYEDADGNKTTQDQNVVLVDNVPPAPDASSLSDVTKICSLPSLTAPTATDNCGGAVTVTNNATFPITANMTVTWTFEDGSGNTATQNQNVVITEPDVALDIAVVITDVVAGNDGVADVTVTGGNEPYSYDWNDGSTDEDLTNVKAGQYSLTVTDANGCDLSITVTVGDIITAVDPNVASVHLSFYPNPAKDYLHIEATFESVADVDIQLLDISGRMVLSKRIKSTKVASSELNLTELRSGIYVLRISSGDIQQVERISISH